MKDKQFSSLYQNVIVCINLKLKPVCNTSIFRKLVSHLHHFSNNNHFQNKKKIKIPKPVISYASSFEHHSLIQCQGYYAIVTKSKRQINIM